ncbi:MAG: acetylglutamate kinase [Candidatus Omnitrophica bacterium]|nr:acetylglutamate kinase [Candidatus Omnitrophota bacterium]
MAEGRLQRGSESPRIPSSIVRKADVLLEALPYLQAFRGKTVVVKYGGSALSDRAKRRAILQDLIFLSVAGIRPVLVHGAGPEITRQMSRRNRPPRFVQGLRVTDAATLKLVVNAMTGVNRMLVKELLSLGGRAQGIVGSDGGLLRAEPYTIPGEELGFVGRVTGVNPGPVQRLLVLGVIPVVAPVGIGWDHQRYNINADEAASALAAALKAEKFVLVTDVAGVLRHRGDPRSPVPTLTVREARRLMEKRVIADGMIPKARACIHALRGGVRKTHMIGIAVPHGLLLEIFTDRGVGTEIVRR